MDKSEQPPRGTEQRYSLERLTIVPLDRPFEIPEPLRAFRWPAELLGKGETNHADGSLEVHYPKGDGLLSFVTTFHELGHLRQKELNPAIAALSPGSHERLLAEEQDAWERGWRRIERACPDVIATLEGRVAAHRVAGTLPDIASFRALYEWVRDHVLTIVEAQRVLFEEGDRGAFDVQRWEALAVAFERQGLRAFLERYAAMRTGEQVDSVAIEDMIRRVVATVVRE
ncbi:hypothetical protein HY634_02230 [Candidatus Uhrbacteria bacterium]|nr:hypothetical protein [Candidatus Uhrbacteria bacterium]